MLSYLRIFNSCNHSWTSSGASSISFLDIEGKTVILFYTRGESGLTGTVGII